MMSMLPGFNSEMMPQGNDKTSQMVIKKYITIIESMTEKELDTMNIKQLQVRASRRVRSRPRPRVCACMCTGGGR